MAHPPPSLRRSADPAAPRIVGIGASAGGLDAIERFLAQVPAQSGLAYVVVQHLDPHHKAMLVELLQRVTSMPVREAGAGMPVAADSVYVIPPNCELTVQGGALHIGAPGRPRGLRLPIDVLFCSLAREQGERAIGVVLSGMGSDGTVGLQAIKTLGGLTLAQLPESAQFGSMPSSAIAAGCVDIIAAPDQMVQRILTVAGSSTATAQLPQASATPDGDLRAILELLRERCKHDLSLYKPSTLTRRIERRVAVHGLASIAAYAAFLGQNPQELDLLFKEMLIGVTRFFRDPTVWAELKASVLPALIARAGPAARLRAWVVGCSTGEEAYTLAMAFIELVGDTEPDRPTLQIFGTDINADAIAIARRGCYPARIADDLTPERLGRHFSARGDGYVINAALRDMVLFAQQDVLLDPPFTRLDLLSCRNLLIYFNASLQRRLMPLFHYSLRPGGVMLLGGSETVGRAQTLFTPLDLKSRFYQRNDQPARIGAVDFPIHQRRSQALAPKQESQVSQATQMPGNLQSLADQLVLRDFAPATVLVTEHGDIVYISGRTGKYLEPAAGKANWNIYVMARPGIRTQLAAAMREVAIGSAAIELNGLQIEGDSQHAVDISVRVLKEPAALQGMRLIVFRDVAAVPARRRRTVAGASVDPGIVAELARAQAEVHALRLEMRASEEELQAANEELQSTNEELQSANEELTTSKEEAQSMNEELQTINTELQSKLDDLALAQSDMQNLLNSTEIATLFLDSALNVRRYTEQMTRIIHLREADVGRPLSELASTLNYPQLHDDARQTLRTLAFSEKQVSTSDDHWYAVRIMPYRTLANEIQGVVITFVDITATKELESRLRGG